MIVTWINLYLAFWFSREAYRLATRSSRITIGRWFWNLLLAYLGFAAVTLIGVLIGASSSGRMKSDDWLLVFAFPLGRLLIIAIPALIAWLVGLVLRKPTINPNEMFYVSNNGEVMGPFAIREIAGFVSAGSLSGDVQICKEGMELWTRWAEVSSRVPKQETQHKTPMVLPKWLSRFKDSLHPSSTMNYKIFVPAMVLALLLGALLHSWLGERYRVFAAGNGWVMKTDKWTGKTWKCYGSGNTWIPVQEAP